MLASRINLELYGIQVMKMEKDVRFAQSPAPETLDFAHNSPLAGHISVTRVMEE